MNLNLYWGHEKCRSRWTGITHPQRRNGRKPANVNAAAESNCRSAAHRHARFAFLIICRHLDGSIYSDNLFVRQFFRNGPDCPDEGRSPG